METGEFRSYCEICGDFNPNSAESNICEECESLTYLDPLVYTSNHDYIDFAVEDNFDGEEEKPLTDQELADELGITLQEYKDLDKE